MTISARRQQPLQRPARSASFAATAEEHLDDVYAYLVYLTRDRTLAEDLTADTFEKALRLWGRFDGRRASARTWLCQIARTTALDWFRAEERRRRREERSAPADRVEEEFGDGLSAELEEALASLTAGEREVIALRILLELDGEEAARVLGISPTNVSTRLSRALEKLNARLEEKVDAHV
jgi:RNA polymerase sigma-70 factor, ECF subfamily